MGDGTAGGIDKERVYAALAKIVATDEFAASPQLAAFLTFSVGQTLDGRGQALKAYTIATEVLGRPSSFDPQNDPIVRVEATRLRRAMERYYATDGASDSLRIIMPRGGYSVNFENGDASPARGQDYAGATRRSANGSRSIKPIMMIAAAVLVTLGLAGGVWFLWTARSTEVPSPQILSLQLANDLALDEARPTNAIPRSNQSWKPRIAAISIKRDEATKMVMDDIVNIMIRFDGIALFGESALPDPLPDDLYTLEGLSRAGNATVFDLRLIHAATGRIVLARSIARQSDTELMDSTLLKIALEIAGRDGVLRSDALPSATTSLPSEINGHGCLAIVHVSIKTKEDMLLAQARKCLDQLLRTSAHSAMLLAISADLRRNELTPDLDKAKNEATLALAIDPKNITAMQVLSELLEAKEIVLSLRVGDTVIERNPYDPAFLRSQARRLNAIGRVGRAEQLLTQADKIE
jgi:hypothetical protein